jgi:transglutaminase-like putative cysteine protease
VSTRLSSRIAGCAKRQGLLSGALILVILCSLAYGLADAVQGIERGLLWPVVLIGLLLGWGLACSSLSGWHSALVSLLVGAVLMLLRVGQLGGPLASLVGESPSVVAQVLQGIVPPDVTTVQSAWAELAGGGGVLVARVQSWLLNMARGQPIFDPVPTALFWGMALWATVVWASWQVWRRAQTLLAVAPAFALLATVLARVGGRAVFLLPMLIATLVLKALIAHEARSRHWQQLGLRLSPGVRADTMWMASGVSLALVVIAALIPSVSVYRIADLIRNLSPEQVEEGDIARSLGLEPQSGPATIEVHLLDAKRAPGLPTRHLIGSGPELADQLVMEVRVEPTRREGGRSIAAQNGTNGTDGTVGTVSPYYWRGLTYERYTDRGWSTEYAVRVRYSAGELAIPAYGENRRLLRQNVRLTGTGDGLVYVAGSLVTADRDYQVAWRTRPAAEQPGDFFGATVEAKDYRSDSLVAELSEETLRSAGRVNPAWVTERYLELPDSVPARVLALARDLTATEPTPYDRARAIERYLRTFPYTLDLPAPPPDRDIVDYFLFDLKRGYCDYYASAMVVLARAAGLPARLATGYLSGFYDEAGRRYLVTEDQAHAWAEVYFPGHGWIAFEPTAGRPAIDRPRKPVTAAARETAGPLEPITTSRSRQRTAVWLGIAGGLFALALVAAFAWWFIDGWRVRRMSPDVAVPHLYRRLYRHGRGLGMAPRAGDTPHEFAAAFELRLSALVRGRRWGALLATAPEEIGWLTDLCERALYAPRRTRAKEREAALQRWRRLRARLWLARLFSSSALLYQAFRFWQPWGKRV